MGPDVGEGWSGLSTVHAVTRSVRDSAALLDASAGPEVGDPYWAPPAERPFLEEMGRSPGRLRVALVTRAFNGADTHPDCVSAAQHAAGLCASLGHHVEEALLATDAGAIGEAVRVIVAANLRATLDERAQALGRKFTPDDVEPLTYATAAQTFDAAKYARAIRVVHRAGRQVGRFFTRYDVLLTPTMATPPLKLGALALTNADSDAFLKNLGLTVGFTQLMNIAGNPAMSVPLFWSPQGLPVGVQFAAGFGGEATLFRIAAQLEQAQPWADRRPEDANAASSTP